MLTPEYLQQITDKAENMMAKLREDIVRAMVERYLARMKRGEENKIIPADRMLAETLQAAGLLFRDVVKIVRDYTGESDRIVREMFRDAGMKAVKFEDKEYKKAGLANDGSHMSPTVKRIINRNYKATNGTMQNITGTLANKSQKTFINVCSEALYSLQTGAKTISKAYIDAINEIAKTGGYVEYDSGRKDTVETAVLRALRTGLTQTSAEITVQRAKEEGYDLVLVSAHLGARVNPVDRIADHMGWQGKIYSLSGKNKKYEKLEDATGYPTNPLGLCGYNCRHNFTIFIPGISVNPYRDKKGNLIINGTKINNEENKKKYEQEQTARRMERQIRKTKIKKQALETAYKNAEGEKKDEIGKELKKVKNGLRTQNAQYRDYMDENDMKSQDYRAKVAIRDIENKNIANTKNGEIRFIGKIDKEIYKCITKDIVTDEVVITDNQLRHILDRHPDAYKNVIENLKEVLQAPDYIIQDKHPNTGLVIKNINQNNEYIQMVLKIYTQNDKPGYKNSVISCWRISEKRLQNYLRNKVVLYKNE